MAIKREIDRLVGRFRRGRCPVRRVFFRRYSIFFIIVQIQVLDYGKESPKRYHQPESAVGTAATTAFTDGSRCGVTNQTAVLQSDGVGKNAHQCGSIGYVGGIL